MATAILTFVITALILIPDTTWSVSIETSRQPEKQDQLLNMKAGGPQCAVAPDIGNFAECINLGPTDIDILTGTLKTADNTFSSPYEFDIESSDVSKLTSDIFTGHKISKLDLINDGVITLPFAPLASLGLNCTTLWMNNNKILTIDAFNGPKTLTEVNLAANQIGAISNKAFNNNTNLVTLALYTNNLTSIKAKTFTGLTKLQTLSLNKNVIDSIAVGAFSNLTAIKMVNLSHNSLSSLEKGTFDGLEKAALYLDNNPFVCVCNLQWLKDWLKTNGIASGATCAYPPNTNFEDTNPFVCSVNAGVKIRSLDK